MTDTANLTAPAGQPTPQGNRKVVSKRGRRLLIAIVILLLLGLGAISALLLSLINPRSGVAPEEEAGGITWVKSIYGWGDTPETQFKLPQELYVDEEGVIWITDTSYPDRMFAFSPEGKLLRTIGQDSPERIIGLGPIARALDQRIFAAEPAMDRVRVFSPEGTDLGFFSIPNPIDIATDGDDRMVVSSTAGFAIVNPNDGSAVKVIGERGKGDDQFDTVNGVAMARDGKIYAVDAYNNRLSAYDAEGERLWIVTTGAAGNKVDLTGGGAMAASRETTAEAKLQLPADITIDGRGRLVVVDSLDFTISVFDPKDGELIAKYGEYGTRDGQFIYPSSIAYDPQRDWFAVADAGNSRVQLVRIPDSAATGGAAAAARRALSGPLRACLIPLALLLLLLIAFIVRSVRRRRAEKNTAETPPVEIPQAPAPEAE